MPTGTPELQTPPDLQDDVEGAMMFRNPVFEPIAGAETNFLMSLQGS